MLDTLKLSQQKAVDYTQKRAQTIFISDVTAFLDYIRAVRVIMLILRLPPIEEVTLAVLAKDRHSIETFLRRRQQHHHVADADIIE